MHNKQEASSDIRGLSLPSSAFGTGRHPACDLFGVQGDARVVVGGGVAEVDGVPVVGTGEAVVDGGQGRK